MDEGFCVIEMIFDADARPADYRFLEINPAVREAHRTDADAAGKRDAGDCPRPRRQLVRDLRARWPTPAKPIRFVNEAKALDGRWFDVYAYRLGGAPSRNVALLFNDITPPHTGRGGTRSDWRRTSGADRRKDEFLATLAHELRNPLAPLRNGLQVMKLARNNARGRRAGPCDDGAATRRRWSG